MESSVQAANGVLSRAWVEVPLIDAAFWPTDSRSLRLGYVVENGILVARECMGADKPPPSVDDCLWCSYRRDAREAEDWKQSWI